MLKQNLLNFSGLIDSSVKSVLVTKLHKSTYINDKKDIKHVSSWPLHEKLSFL